MRKRLSVVLVALILALSVWHSPQAQATCLGTGTYNGYAHETITVSTTALGFNSVLYEQASGNASSALVAVETNAIRWFADGTIAPTTTVGFPAAAGSNIEICGFSNIKNFRMIRQSADATITVQYFR